MIPMNELDPYLVQVPEPQDQSADLYILEMPQIDPSPVPYYNFTG